MKYTAHLLAGMALLAACESQPVNPESATIFQPRVAASQSFGDRKSVV